MTKRQGDAHNWVRAALRRPRAADDGPREVGAELRRAGSCSSSPARPASTTTSEVTLFGVHPDDLKACVYTMRYDEASARYAEFGPFVTGMVGTLDEVLSAVGVPPGSCLRRLPVASPPRCANRQPVTGCDDGSAHEEIGGGAAGRMRGRAGAGTLGEHQEPTTTAPPASTVTTAAAGSPRARRSRAACPTRTRPASGWRSRASRSRSSRRTGRSPGRGGATPTGCSRCRSLPRATTRSSSPRVTCRRRGGEQRPPRAERAGARGRPNTPVLFPSSSATPAAGGSPPTSTGPPDCSCRACASA